MNEWAPTEPDLFVSISLFLTESLGARWSWLPQPQAWRRLFLSRIHDHLAFGAHSQMPVCGDICVDNKELRCAGRSLFYLKATEIQSSVLSWRSRRAQMGQALGGESDPLPATHHSFWTVRPAYGVFLLWWLWCWDSGFSEHFTVNTDFCGRPRPGRGVRYWEIRPRLSLRAKIVGSQDGRHCRQLLIPISYFM